MRYDIAVLTLAVTLTYGPTINKIALPMQNEETEAGIQAFVTGFGYATEQDWMNNDLRGVRVPILSKTECQKTSLYVPDTICAGAPEGERDACQVNYIKTYFIVLLYLSYNLK